MAEPMRDDKMIYPLLSGGLLTEIIEEFEKSNLPPLCFMGLLPGAQAALDYCSGGNCGGMLWLRLASVTPSVDFATPSTFTMGPSLNLHAFTIEVGVVRGMPASPRGMPPTADQYAELMRIQLADMSAIRRAVCRFLTSIERDYEVGTYLPSGPAGLCVGGAWNFNIRQDF